jgi:SEC-C motif-containing protein
MMKEKPGSFPKSPKVFRVAHHYPKASKTSMTDFCICGSKKPFEKCCSRFLSGNLYAKTPEQLLRSRYAAYALGGYGDYLLSTWFSATSSGLNADSLSEKTVEWVKLDILSRNQKGDKATVKFNTFFYETDSPDVQVSCETSVFQRTTGQWLYVGGEVTSGDE